MKSGIPHRAPRATICLLLLAVPPALVGCGAPTSTTSARPPATADRAASATEIWEALYLQGAKVGYGHTTVRPAPAENDESLIEVDSLNHLAITRFGQQSEHDVKMRTVETPDGRLRSFRTEVALGPKPVVTTGRVDGGELLVTISTGGRSETTRLPWSDDVLGFRGIEQSLERRPLRPGEKRSLKMLMPLVNQIAEVELTALALENTPVLGVEARLLRVDTVARIPGQGAIETTLWLDADGNAIKSRVAGVDQESYRTTKQLALAPGGEQRQFDLGLDLIVPVKPPLEQPHQTRRVRYRVELPQGDPAGAFATGSTQQVRSVDPHTAEITVLAGRPGASPAGASQSEPPSSEFTAANSVLQSDDPRIRKLAAEAKQGASTPAEVALALERFVHQAVSEKDFSQGFATAADVAESRAGDCTEHAVLLAALLRAAGIPSRVAIGLVYVEHAGGFGYHMWTEAYLNGHWIPLDGIVGRGGTSAAYLKLADSSLAGTSAYSSFLAVAQVLGQLKVSVIESE